MVAGTKSAVLPRAGCSLAAVGSEVRAAWRRFRKGWVEMPRRSQNSTWARPLRRKSLV
jgi:hypothetical protein